MEVSLIEAPEAIGTRHLIQPAVQEVLDAGGFGSLEAVLQVGLEEIQQQLRLGRAWGQVVHNGRSLTTLPGSLERLLHSAQLGHLVGGYKGRSSHFWI
jgi:hypothetical protein